MPDTIQQRALHYLYGQLRKARIAFGYAERKQNSAEEIVHLQEKIDVLEWLAGVALNGEDVLRNPVRPEELPFFLGNFCGWKKRIWIWFPSGRFLRADIRLNLDPLDGLRIVLSPWKITAKPGAAGQRSPRKKKGRLRNGRND
jgi:hypothetical protein